MRFELEQAEEAEERTTYELSERRRKVIRLRKQLRQAEQKTEKALNKELEDIESAKIVKAVGAAEAGVKAETRPFFSDVLEMPLDAWASIDSWDFLEIPNLQPKALL